MLALIDGDIVAYRCSASANHESEDIAVLRTDIMMRDILAGTDSNEYKCLLTGPGNFRYELYPDYKANRKDKEKPILKGAWIDSSVFIGDKTLKELASLKSKNELLGEIIGLLQSPAKNVISALQSGSNKLSGILTALEKRAN